MNSTLHHVACLALAVSLGGCLALATEDLTVEPEPTGDNVPASLYWEKWLDDETLLLHIRGDEEVLFGYAPHPYEPSHSSSISVPGLMRWVTVRHESYWRVAAAGQELGLPLPKSIDDQRLVGVGRIPPPVDHFVVLDARLSPALFVIVSDSATMEVKAPTAGLVQTHILTSAGWQNVVHVETRNAGVFYGSFATDQDGYSDALLLLDAEVSQVSVSPECAIIDETYEQVWLAVNGGLSIEVLTARSLFGLNGAILHVVELPFELPSGAC